MEPVLPATAEKVTENLLLEALWSRLSEEARAQARAMSVLRVPAPRPVVVALGGEAATAELIQAGVVTQFKEQSRDDEGRAEWVDRWGMHSVVGAFAGARTGEEERRAAHRKAGVAFTEWVKGSGARLAEYVEGIAHLHAVGEGDWAWPMAERYVLWARDMAQYQEALRLLDSCERAGTTRGRLVRVLTLQAQMRRALGERSNKIREILSRALGIVETDEDRGLVLHESGLFARAQGDYPEAERLLRKAAEISRRGSDTHSPNVILQHALAEVLGQQGRYDDAEIVLRKLIKDDEYLSDDRREHGALLHSLAIICEEQGKLHEAEAFLREALGIKTTVFGTEHPEYAVSLKNLAGVLLQQDKGVEAENLLRQVLDIEESTLGPEHPEYAISLNNLADTLGRLGNLEEAAELLRRALDIKQKIVGATHPSYGASTQNLAAVLFMQGNNKEAESLLRQAVVIDEKAFGADHPRLVKILEALAVVLIAQGRAFDAEPLLRRALAIAEEHGQSDAAAQVREMIAVLEDAASSAAPPPPAAPVADAPCPCGSERPFLACHGAPGEDG